MYCLGVMPITSLKKRLKLDKLLKPQSKQICETVIDFVLQQLTCIIYTHFINELYWSFSGFSFKITAHGRMVHTKALG
jgi:hypothetical protein